MQYDDPADEQGCSCHIAPPCSFCMSLSEEELDIYSNEGLAALIQYRLVGEKKKES